MNTIILDFETSGLNPYHDDIIEIGAKVMGSDNYYATLVKPKSNQYISKKITEITGITNRTLRNEGKEWVTAYSDFYNWLLDQLKEDRENIIVSHNGTTFDFLFLKRMILDLKQKGDNVSGIDEYTIIYVDTLLLSRRLLPNRSYYNQGSLCKTFNIPIDVSHRAMGDVMCLEQLYEKLMNVLKRDYNTLTGKIVEDFINLKI